MEATDCRVAQAARTATRKLAEQDKTLAAAKQKLQVAKLTKSELEKRNTALKKESQREKKSEEAFLAEEEKLADDITHAQQQFAELQRQHANSKSQFAFVPFDGVSGTTRRPIFIECTGQGLRILPENEFLGEAELQGFTERFNPLLMGARTLTQYWKGEQKLKPEKVDPKSAPYVLLLVRPKGCVTYYLARQFLSDLGQPFGYELIEEDFPIHIPDADPQAKVLLRGTLMPLWDRNEAIASATARDGHPDKIVELEAFDGSGPKQLDPIEERRQASSLGPITAGKKSGAASSSKGGRLTSGSGGSSGGGTGSSSSDDNLARWGKDVAVSDGRRRADRQALRLGKRPRTARIRRGCPGRNGRLGGAVLAGTVSGTAEQTGYGQEGDGPGGSGSRGAVGGGSLGNGNGGRRRKWIWRIRFRWIQTRANLDGSGGPGAMDLGAAVTVQVGLVTEEPVAADQGGGDGSGGNGGGSGSGPGGNGAGALDEAALVFPEQERVAAEGGGGGVCGEWFRKGGFGGGGTGSGGLGVGGLWRVRWRRLRRGRIGWRRHGWRLRWNGSGGGGRASGSGGGGGAAARWGWFGGERFVARVGWRWGGGLGGGGRGVVESAWADSAVEEPVEMDRVAPA